MLGYPPPSQGVAFIFIPAGGGGSPLDPLPPSPLRSNSSENQGSGNLFRLGQLFPPAPSAHLYHGCLVTPLYPFFPLLQTPCPNVPSMRSSHPGLCLVWPRSFEKCDRSAICVVGERTRV